MNCTLRDPVVSIEMVLRENFIAQVEHSRTYMFHDITVRKDGSCDNVHLNTAKSLITRIHYLNYLHAFLST